MGLIDVSRELALVSLVYSAVFLLLTSLISAVSLLSSPTWV